MSKRESFGAFPKDDGTVFRVRAINAKRVSVVLFEDSEQEKAQFPLAEIGEGIFEGFIPGAGHGSLYKYKLDQRKSQKGAKITGYDSEVLPDPFARWLPYGVHGPAMVYSSQFPWKNSAPKPDRKHLVMYEMHIGTFTPGGNFKSAEKRLSYLKDLGVNTIEVMPISSFPGKRGWGYDGVAHFAPFAGYGTPWDVKRFIDSAHGLGLSVILDLVLNHFGPDGNYLYAYCRDFFDTGRKTPWGDALNYQNPFLRNYFLDCVEQWLVEYRFDGFRLDAVQHICDSSTRHILAEIRSLAENVAPDSLLFAEDNRNEAYLLTDFGLHGIWADDFHHQIRVLLTGERDGYYRGFKPDVEDLAKIINHGWLYDGRVWPLTGKPRGTSAASLKAEELVYFIQNHDQIGNRPLGDRLNSGIEAESFLAVTALLFFLPMTPMIFMGQEWAATSPFLFFSDHNKEIGRAVSKGRREEFRHFTGFSDPLTRQKIPDPQDERTFIASKLNWRERGRKFHRGFLELTRTLLRMRREHPVLSLPDRKRLEARCWKKVLLVKRWNRDQELILAVNLGAEVSLAEIPFWKIGAEEVIFSTVSLARDILPARTAVIVSGRRK